MLEVEYIEANHKDLNIIGPLWQKQLEHHMTHSKHFKKQLGSATFEGRAIELLGKSEHGDMLIDLVKDVSTKNIVGYCVSTIDMNRQGEIDSIYVEPEYRRDGIGKSLMERAISWMNSKSVPRKMLVVADGNEEVFDFYKQFSFYPKTTILVQNENERG